MSDEFLTHEVSLDVLKVHPDATLPTRAHVGDLGYDLYALEETILSPGMVTKVRTGIACAFPPGYGALVRDRSSVATKFGLVVVAGVIDNGYRGEILVAILNPIRTSGLCDLAVVLEKGQKIAQLIPFPVTNWLVREVGDLSSTARGTGGFGSTGK